MSFELQMSQKDQFIRTSDELAIIRAVNGIGIRADEKNWMACVQFFAQQVEVDYSSLTGIDPERMDSVDMLAGWRKILQPIQATQHMITNHLVTINDSLATCVSHVQAYHWHKGCKSGETWIVWGTYTHRLIQVEERWLVCGMKLVVKRQEGNRELLDEASRSPYLEVRT